MCVVSLSHDLSYDVCVCRGDPCTWTVHVHLLCQSYYGCSNGTVTKDGSTGHGWRGEIQSAWGSIRSCSRWSGTGDGLLWALGTFRKKEQRLLWERSSARWLALELI